MTRKSSFLLASVLATYSIFACAENYDDGGELPEIEVREALDDGDTATVYSAIKAPVAYKDLPFTVETLPAKILQSINTQNLESLLDSFSTVTASPAEGGLASAIILRGFTDAGFYRNGLNNSLGAMPLHDTANIESVEILKGASSALYGPGEPGGTVNILTKKPQFEQAGTAQISIGRYQHYRGEFDSTGTLHQGHKLAYRMIAAYEQANSFRDSIESDKVFAAPSLLWQPDAHWSWLAEIEYSGHKSPYDTGVVAVDGRFPLPISSYNGEPQLGKTRLQAISTSLGAEYQADDQWNLSAKMLWQNTDNDGLHTEPNELDDETFNGERLLSRQLQREMNDADGFSAQLELSKKFNMADFQHQILFGYEYTLANNYVELDGSDEEAEAFAINIWQANFGQGLPALSELRRTKEKLSQHSIYIQDFISFGENLKIVIGSRFDKVDIDTSDSTLNTEVKQNDDDISSRFAVLYALTKNLSLFGSFGQSNETNEGLTPRGTPLLPSRGKSFDAGIKFRHSYANLALDLSIYEIEQTNIASDAPGAPGFEIQTARQKSSGIDLDFSFNPLQRMFGSIKYVYTDAGVFDDPDIPDGSSPINTALHILLLTSFLSLDINKQGDLQVGLNLKYRSARKASVDADELNVELPAYWIANLFAEYSLSERTKLSLNINNLFNNNYIAASQADLLHLHPGQPLSFTASIRINF